MDPTFNYVRDLPTITTKYLYYIYIFNKHKIDGYFRYVDYIWSIYKSMHTNINGILDEFNNVPSTLEFTLEQKQNTSLNFLDIITKNAT